MIECATLRHSLEEVARTIQPNTDGGGSGKDRSSRRCAATVSPPRRTSPNTCLYPLQSFELKDELLRWLNTLPLSAH